MSCVALTHLFSNLVIVLAVTLPAAIGLILAFSGKAFAAYGTYLFNGYCHCYLTDP